MIIDELKFNRNSIYDFDFFAKIIGSTPQLSDLEALIYLIYECKLNISLKKKAPLDLDIDTVETVTEWDFILPCAVSAFNIHAIFQYDTSTKKLYGSIKTYI